MSSRFSIYLLFLLIAVLIENTITTLPLVFILLLFFSLMKQQRQLVFVLAFICGIILDIFALRPIGITSMYFLFVLFLSIQYERKFHITGFSFFALATALGSFFYLLLFDYHMILLQTILSTCLSIILYIGYTTFNSHPKKLSEYIS